MINVIWYVVSIEYNVFRFHVEKINLKRRELISCIFINFQLT